MDQDVQAKRIQGMWDALIIPRQIAGFEVSAEQCHITPKHHAVSKGVRRSVCEEHRGELCSPTGRPCRHVGSHELETLEFRVGTQLLVERLVVPLNLFTLVGSDESGGQFR